MFIIFGSINYWILLHSPFSECLKCVDYNFKAVLRYFYSLLTFMLVEHNSAPADKWLFLKQQSTFERWFATLGNMQILNGSLNACVWKFAPKNLHYPFDQNSSILGMNVFNKD